MKFFTNKTLIFFTTSLLLVMQVLPSTRARPAEVDSSADLLINSPEDPKRFTKPNIENFPTILIEEKDEPMTWNKPDANKYPSISTSNDKLVYRLLENQETDVTGEATQDDEIHVDSQPIESRLAVFSDGVDSFRHPSDDSHTNHELHDDEVVIEDIELAEFDNVAGIQANGTLPDSIGPYEGTVVAQASPSFTAIVGANGKAQAMPSVSAIAGPGGLAIALPSAQAFAGSGGMAMSSLTANSRAGAGGIAMAGGNSVAIAGISPNESKHENPSSSSPTIFTSKDSRYFAEIVGNPFSRRTNMGSFPVINNYFYNTADDKPVSLNRKSAFKSHLSDASMFGDLKYRPYPTINSRALKQVHQRNAPRPFPKITEDRLYSADTYEEFKGI